MAQRPWAAGPRTPGREAAPFSRGTSPFGDSCPCACPARAAHTSHGHVLKGDTAPFLSQELGHKARPLLPLQLRLGCSHGGIAVCHAHLAARAAHDAAAGLPVLESPLELYFPRGNSVIQPERKGPKDTLRTMVQGTETGQHMCSCSHTVPRSPCDLPGPMSPTKNWQQAAATPCPSWLESAAARASDA